ncbi:MAG: hypothetical protein LRY54_00580 [Alphaproteobacteria bacterium]|nr:hypothetical protein [Alphaproteobacteria bacterium]
MSKKLYLSTLETLPEGVKITRIFGLVSGNYWEISGLGTVLAEDCAIRFPTANAVLGVNHSESIASGARRYHAQGTAVEISGHDPNADFICAK